MSLKSTEQLCVMKMKNDAKFEEELTCHFKIDMRNLINFDLSARSLKDLQFDGLLLSKVILFELKKYRGAIFHEAEEGFKIWRGINLLFQNWHKEFDKF